MGHQPTKLGCLSEKRWAPFLPIYELGFYLSQTSKHLRMSEGTGVLISRELHHDTMSCRYCTPHGCFLITDVTSPLQLSEMNGINERKFYTGIDTKVHTWNIQFMYVHSSYIILRHVLLGRNLTCVSRQQPSTIYSIKLHTCTRWRTIESYVYL